MKEFYGIWGQSYIFIHMCIYICIHIYAYTYMNINLCINKSLYIIYIYYIYIYFTTEEKFIFKISMFVVDAIVAHIPRQRTLDY